LLLVADWLEDGTPMERRMVLCMCALLLAGGCGTDYEPAVRELEALAAHVKRAKPADNGYCDDLDDLEKELESDHIDTLPGSADFDPDDKKLSALRDKFRDRVSDACKDLGRGLKKCGIDADDFRLSYFQAAVETCQRIHRKENP
jgi:hypothetical protein